MKTTAPLNEGSRMRHVTLRVGQYYGIEGRARMRYPKIAAFSLLEIGFVDLMLMGCKTVATCRPLRKERHFSNFVG